MILGCKETSSFQNFKPNVICAPEMASALVCQVRAVESTVEAGAQFQQMVNVECVAGRKFNSIEIIWAIV